LLRSIFRPKRVEVIGGCRKLHNEGLHNLYSSPDIIRIIKSGNMKWVWHIACMRMINAHRTFVRKCLYEAYCETMGKWLLDLKWIFEALVTLYMG
jgi:hypothetical protein